MIKNVIVFYYSLLHVLDFGGEGGRMEVRIMKVFALVLKLDKST